MVFQRALILLLLLLPLPGLAVTGNIVELGRDHDGTQLSLAPEIFRDASGHSTVDTLTADAFRPMAQRDLRAFYTRDVIWLRFTFHNPEATAQQRFLEISPPRLEDIRLYEADAAGRWSFQQAGMVVPVLQRLVPSRLSVFPLQLTPGETRTVYVRIATRNAIMFNFRLWEPDGFHIAERRIDFVNGVQFGALVLFMLYALIFYGSTRDPSFLLFGTMVVFCALNDLSLFQYSYSYFWPEAHEWNLRSPGILGSPTIIVSTWLLLRLLRLKEYLPRAALILHVWAAVMVLLMPVILVGDYLFWVNVQQALGLTLLVLQVVVTVYAARRGVQDAWLVVLSFLAMWVLGVARMAQVFGWLPPHLAVDYSQYWGILLSGMLLVGVMTEKMRKLSLGRAEAERDAMEARIQAEQDVLLHTRELRMEKEMAEATSRAKSAFLAQLSHELRTPLHSILGYSGLMLNDGQNANDRRRIGAIQQSGRHLLALIDELLDYARLEANRLVLEPRPVYLQALLEGVLHEARSLAHAESLSLSLRLGADLPMVVLLDPVRLRQVLINLISNACRHSDGRHVLLSAEAGERDSQGRLRLRFAVQDDGRGIAPEDRDRIFHPFEQGLSQREGMGLGLAIARQFVHLMRGDIYCEDAPGGGTLFHFTLQVEEALEAQPLLQGELTVRRYKGAVRRVLVVDDILDNRALMADVLATLGFEVALAEGGHAALALLAQSQAPFDLVITDQLMPDMSGWEFLRSARAAGHAMPFILLSGAAPVLPDGWQPHLVFAAILMKPAEPVRLAEALASVLRLEWEEAGHAGFAAEVATGALARPSPDILAELREAAEQGRISDIEDWVEQTLQGQPECQAFALAIRQAVRRLDLPGIVALVET